MNIGDIARMAGVSRAAVSRYLNNGYVSSDKRERIRRVIEETGYQPSHTAQTLRTKKTRLIGVILPRINSDSISSITTGISAVLQEAGYDMLLAATGNDPERELHFLRIFSDSRVDGVILVATVFTREHKKILKNYKIPVVLVGQHLPGFTCIYHDDFEAGYALTRHMLSKGRKRFAFIGVLHEDVAVGKNRLKGFQKALGEAGYSFPDERYEIADFSIESGYESMKKVLDRCGDIDAVVCATDRIAVGAMNAVTEKGKRIPKDIALAGFGDNIISGVTTPSLTTVHFYYYECGEKAAGAILAAIDGTAGECFEEKLGFELLPRGSV